jgi:hypothetical protein
VLMCLNLWLKTSIITNAAVVGTIQCTLDIEVIEIDKDIVDGGLGAMDLD